MRRRGTGERTLGLFLLALAAFTPPILAVFNVAAVWLGMPVLFIYVFAAWAGLIVLMGISADRAARRRSGTGGTPPEAGEGR